MAMGYGKTWKMRQRPSVSLLITSVVSLGIALLIGNQILTVVGTIIGNQVGTPFEQALEFLGMNTSGAGTWASNSIVGLLGFVAVATFVLSFVKISLKGNL